MSDSISRQAVLDICKKEIDHISKNWQNYHSPSEAKSGFEYIATNIYDLPSTENKGEWIPVTERLPKIGQGVIATIEYYDGEFEVVKTLYDKYGFCCGKATAWQPLPEPYKAESEG